MLKDLSLGFEGPGLGREIFTLTTLLILQTTKSSILLLKILLLNGRLVVLGSCT